MSRLSTDMHPLLTQTNINLLFSKGIYTITNFLESEITQIALITNFTYKQILIIKKHIINKNSAVNRNAQEYYNELLTNSAIIPTGIENVDIFLEGGLSTGNIYELCGLPASGKTQFCLTLSKNIAQKLQQNVFYIDTKGDFSGKKIKEMLNHSNSFSEDEILQVMSKILVKRVHTVYELINSLYEIKSDLHKKKLKLRTIIIDSILPLFYFSSNHFKNYPIMNYLINIMRILATEYHVAFVITNIITTWYEGDFKNCVSYTEKIGLGKYWLSIPDTRLKIIKINNSTCEVITIKSNTLPMGKKCIVSVSNIGM